MKTKLLIISILILSKLGCSPNLYGQPTPRTNINMIKNGKVWVPNTSISEAKQFFLERMDLKGKFLYKGIQYDNIEFAYDLSSQTIITSIETEYKTKRYIVVNPYFLDGFSIDDSSIKYEFLKGKLIHEKLAPNDYYQIVKFNNTQYVINRKKHKTLKSDGSKNFKYTINNDLYLIKDDKLVLVNRKNDILEIFPSKKKEIKRFIRNNKLKIRAKTPMDVIVLLSKFDQ